MPKDRGITLIIDSCHSDGILEGSREIIGGSNRTNQASKKNNGMTQTYLHVAVSLKDAGCETGLSSKYVKVCFSAMLVVLLSSSFFLEPFVHCFDKIRTQTVRIF